MHLLCIYIKYNLLYIYMDKTSIYSNINKKIKCISCDGYGRYIITYDCYECNNTGWINCIHKRNKNKKIYHVDKTILCCIPIKYTKVCNECDSIQKIVCKDCVNECKKCRGIGVI